MGRLRCVTQQGYLVGDSDHLGFVEWLAPNTTTSTVKPWKDAWHAMAKSMSATSKTANGLDEAKSPAEANTPNGPNGPNGADKTRGG